jgi:hypothetical protein
MKPAISRARTPEAFRTEVLRELRLAASRFRRGQERTDDMAERLLMLGAEKALLLVFQHIKTIEFIPNEIQADPSSGSRPSGSPASGSPH